MNKALEIVANKKESLKAFKENNYTYAGSTITEVELETIEAELQRLEAIDNAKPSEAVKKCDELENVIEGITMSNVDLKNTLRTSVLIATIKQALLQTQKYKELEQELGCPLDVLHKALKNGIYNYGGEDTLTYSKVQLNYNGRQFVLIADIFKIRTLKNYKKTWWLKEDRSE